MRYIDTNHDSPNLGLQRPVQSSSIVFSHVLPIFEQNDVIDHNSGIRVRRTFLALCIVLGFLQAWASRMTIISDTVSYLDIGDFYLARALVTSCQRAVESTVLRDPRCRRRISSTIVLLGISASTSRSVFDLHSHLVVLRFFPAPIGLAKARDRIARRILCPDVDMVLYRVRIVPVVFVAADRSLRDQPRHAGRSIFLSRLWLAREDSSRYCRMAGILRPGNRARARLLRRSPLCFRYRSPVWLLRLSSEG